MPLQAPQWTEFLLCHVCCKQFDAVTRQPVSLGCGHTVCLSCLSRLNRQQCPFDQTEIKINIKDLPVNYSLLQLVGESPPETQLVNIDEVSAHQADFDASRKAIEALTLYLKPLLQTSNLSSGPSNNSQNALGNSTFNGLTRQMQRKLVTLVNCQLAEEEGRCRAVRAARSLGERAVKELILLHQNPQHLSTNLWTAVRLRGCQFLGPAMQDEVLKLILLSLDNGSALCRKVLVLYVVQQLEGTYSQASKTSIGHVVQLLYRASCFKVTKREGESSLLQLQDKYRTFSALRKEHDAQIVKIAMEAGLHISPEQWSSLLYGDDDHKSHMQSIIDKLQTPESFGTSIHELLIALQKTGDPSELQLLCSYLDRLAKIDPNPEGPPPTWDEMEEVLNGLQIVIRGLVDFAQSHNFMKMKSSAQSAQSSYSKFKTRMCRDVKLGTCPRGDSCSFAHSDEELKRHRRRRTPSQTMCGNGIVKLSSSPDQGLESVEEDIPDNNCYGYRRNDMQNQNGGCASNAHQFSSPLPHDIDRFNSYGKTMGSAQVSDTFVTSRPMSTPMEGTFSGSSSGFYLHQVNGFGPGNNFMPPAPVSTQQYQTDAYVKKYQDQPGYCLPSSAHVQPLRQPNTMYEGIPSTYPDYGPMYLVPNNMAAYSILTKSIDSKEKDEKTWDFGKSSLSALAPNSLDDICSPLSSASSGQESPKSQLLGDSSSSTWGSLFGGNSEFIWKPAKENESFENSSDAWPAHLSNPRHIEPIGSRKTSSKDSSSSSSCPTTSSLDACASMRSFYDTMDDPQPVEIQCNPLSSSKVRYNCDTALQPAAIAANGKRYSPVSSSESSVGNKWQLFDERQSPLLIVPPLPYRRGVS